MPQRTDYKALLKRAMKALDAASEKSGKAAEWRLGGGVAMALAYSHRKSYDVDVFVHDPQLIPWLSPRISDEAEVIFESTEYQESLNHLRIKVKDGTVDFVVGPVLTGEDGITQHTVAGRLITVETPIEIVAKKCFYRAWDFQVRDVFDFACLLKAEPAMAIKHSGLLLARKADLLPRLEQLRSSYATLAATLDVEDRWKELAPTAIETVIAFVSNSAERERRSPTP